MHEYSLGLLKNTFDGKTRKKDFKPALSFFLLGCAVNIKVFNNLVSFLSLMLNFKSTHYTVLNRTVSASFLFHYFDMKE